MHTIDSADTLAVARRRLAQIREDPQIKVFALRHAGHPDLAGDVLQRAYYAMARLRNLDQVENLAAYFCTVLVREVHRERDQLGAALVDDFARVAEAHQDGVGCHPVPPPPVSDAACTSVQAHLWLERFAAQRDHLRAGVPARSGDPARYRGVICAAAEQVLRDGINGEPSPADTNPALRAAYPEYFGQPGAAPNTLHQRFRRARVDVRAVLQAVVSREELS